MRPTFRTLLAGLAASLFLLADAPALPPVVHAAVGDIFEFPIPTANSQPGSLVRAWDGNVWFNEGNSNKIGRLGPSGITEFPLPQPGSAGPFALAKDGSVWFTRTNGVATVTPAGVITEYAVPVFGYGPGSITAGPDDAMWFTYGNAAKIGRVTSGGTVTVSDIPSADASGFVPIATGSDGNLWLAYYDSNKIVRLTPSLVATNFPLPTAGGNPLGITAGSDGNLWFTEYNAFKIGRITPAGIITEFPLPAGALNPYSITAGTDGALWFTEQNSNMIGRITTSGVITRYPIPTPNSQPIGIAPCGVLICFTEYGANKIGVLQNGASILVNTLADANPPANDGLCSLREAITNANDNAATWADCPAGARADTITFGVSGTIVLATALPALTDPAGLVIDGSGQSLTVSGNLSVRVFRVAPAGAVTLTSLTVADGRATGPIEPFGGAVLSNGSALSLLNVTVKDSVAGCGCGGVMNGLGGGVFNGSGTLTLTNSVVTGNSGLYGGGIYSAAGTVFVLDESVVKINSAAPEGGGIFNEGTMIARGSRVQNNNAGNGGGLFNNTGAVATVTHSTISGNSSGGDGGGIMNGPSSLGSGGNGGGTLTIIASTVSGNTAVSLGGGITNLGGSLQVVNSTISGNSADHGGGINQYAPETPSLVTVINSTITANSVPPTHYGGGVQINNGVATVVNSIIAGNTGGEPDCSGTLIATGPNLIGVAPGCQVTGIPPIIAAPKLGLLADKGGATKTHALLPGSPAIDAGDDTVCAAPPVSGKDQRDVLRPYGSHCDLGSYEKTTPPDTGGVNLRITTGSIDLAWNSGTAQTDYLLLQYNTATEATNLIPVAGAATSYNDAAAVHGTVYCYVLAAMNGASFLGLSDLLCGLTGISSGTAVPGGFTLTLNQTASATMTWTPPAGGVGSYLLQRIPLDGTPISSVPLSAGVTTTTQAVTSAGTCFQLIAYRVLEFGTTNVLCGVPGVSTLGTAAGMHPQALGELTTSIRERLAGLSHSAMPGGLSSASLAIPETTIKEQR